MVAQVDAPRLALPRDEREHEVPFDPGRGQTLAERMESRVLPRSDVVVEDAHVHSAGGRPLERFEEDVRRPIPGHDVDLDVDVVLGSVDEFGHPLDRPVVVHADAVVGPGDHGQFGEVAGEFGDEVEVARRLERRRDIGQVVGALVHEFVRHRLDARPPAVDVGPPMSRKRGMPTMGRKRMRSDHADDDDGRRFSGTTPMAMILTMYSMTIQVTDSTVVQFIDDQSMGSIRDLRSSVEVHLTGRTLAEAVRRSVRNDGTASARGGWCDSGAETGRVTSRSRDLRVRVRGR